MDTANAVMLLRALSTGAVRAIVFAGGDPSLRRDLADLVSEARGLGLAVQVQTNGQHVSAAFLDSLHMCEYVALSIDGPDPATHDVFRQKRGNFRQIIRFLGTLESRGVPVSIRTVVAQANYAAVPDIADIVAAYSNVIRWKLLEFTAVGNGYTNRSRYWIPIETFEQTVVAVRDRLGSSAHVLEVLRNAEKIGLYMMISAHGLVYGTTGTALMRTGRHDYVGSLLSDHLAHLADKLPFAGRRADRTVPADTHGAEGALASGLRLPSRLPGPVA